MLEISDKECNIIAGLMLSSVLNINGEKITISEIFQIISKLQGQNVANQPNIPPSTQVER